MTRVQRALLSLNGCRPINVWTDEHYTPASMRERGHRQVRKLPVFLPRDPQVQPSVWWFIDKGRCLAYNGPCPFVEPED